MDYSNKTVIITGAAKGIGAACAKLFYDKGANVTVLDVAKDESNIKDETWLYRQCDVSNEQEVKNAIEETIKKFETIDYLINNAGIVRYGTVTETSIEDWNDVLKVNLTSMFLC